MTIIKCFACALFLFIGAPAVAQPVATSDQSIAWTYTDAQIAAGQVNRFEASFDGAAFVDVGFVPRPGIPEEYFTPIPSAPTGVHTVIVLACNADFCGDPSTEFAYRLGAVPSQIDGSTIKIIPTPIAGPED